MSTRHKVLPSGVPDIMFENPETVDALDFKVSQHPIEELCLLIQINYVDHCSRYPD